MARIGSAAAARLRQYRGKTGQHLSFLSLTLSRHWSGLADELKLPAHSGIALTIEDEIIFRAVARNCTAGGRGKVRWEN